MYTKDSHLSGRRWRIRIPGMYLYVALWVAVQHLPVSESLNWYTIHIYFWIRSIFVYQKSLKQMFLTDLTLSTKSPFESFFSWCEFIKVIMYPNWGFYLGFPFFCESSLGELEDVFSKCLYMNEIIQNCIHIQPKYFKMYFIINSPAFWNFRSKIFDRDRICGDSSVKLSFPCSALKIFIKRGCKFLLNKKI